MRVRRLLWLGRCKDTAAERPRRRLGGCGRTFGRFDCAALTNWPAYGVSLVGREATPHWSSLSEREGRYLCWRVPDNRVSRRTSRCVPPTAFRREAGALGLPAGCKGGRPSPPLTTARNG